MRLEIVREFSFRAFCQAPGWREKLCECNYRLQVGMKGYASEHDGIVIEPSEFDRIVLNTVVNKLDGSHLNCIHGRDGTFPNEVPTTENLAMWIGDQLRYILPSYDFPNVTVSMVRLWDTNTSYVEVRYDD